MNTGWPLRPLANCGRLLSGGTPSKAESSYWGGSIPWFSSKEVKSFDLREAELHVTEAGAANGSHLIPPGTVLFVVRGMSLANEFRVGVTAVPATFNQDVKAMVPAEDIDSRYLARCLRWLEPNVLSMTEESSHGTKRLPGHVFEQLPIPMPPLAEQRRLAGILDRADAVRRKRKEAIGLTVELLRSTFLEMFGDPVTNPKGWPVSTFGAELADMEYGPRFYNEKYSDEGVRIVRITDLNASGALDFDSMPRLSMSEADRARYTLKPGEIIFARTGATVGKTALIEEGAPECVAGAYFIRLKLNRRVLPRYARMVLASDRVQALIARRSRQSAQQNFSGPGIRELGLPVPPLPLQHQLVAVVTRCARMESSQRDHAKGANDLFEALMQSAFRGELRAA